MSKERYERGAEWRIWDFQVHTPYSALNNGFGNDFEAYARDFFTKAIEKQIAVVGVTDYFSVEGFRQLRAIQSDSDRLAELLGKENVAAAQAIVLLANVELRSDILVNGSRVNFHIIFSEDVLPDSIEHNFLASLTFTSEGNPEGIDQELALTKRNLEYLGSTLKRQHAPFAGKSDLYIGMMQATVRHQAVSDALKRHDQLFGGRYVFALPCDEDLSKVSWDGQGHMTRKVMIQKSHCLLTSNPNTRDFALGLRHLTPDAYVEEFRSFKACLHGSDAHEPSELFAPDEDRYCWIKADPGFHGLMQVLNEPDSRVFIGEVPDLLRDKRVRATKLLDSVSISRKQGSTLREKWFDQVIHLNPELVAIIGNKGSGKSALADIVGLLGNTPRHQSFSFLSTTRFNDRRSSKGKHFEASCSWLDGKVDGPVGLDQIPKAEDVESIKYIPQEYLEKICNEVSLGSGSRFYEELQQVIFSHVSEAEQLGFSSLDELLQHRSAETKRSIDLLLGELKGITRELAQCEDKLTDTFRKGIEAQLSAKRRELDALKKPEYQAPPTEDASVAAAATAVTALVERERDALKRTEVQILEAQQALNTATRRRTSAERLITRLANLRKQVQAALVDAAADARELGLSLENIVKLETDTSEIEKLLDVTLKSMRDLATSLAPDGEESLVAKKAIQVQSIEKLNLQLSAPQREYEKYKAALKAWDDARTAVIGTPEQLGSLRQLEDELAKIPTWEARRIDLEAARLAKALEIYQEKVKLRDDYSHYYGAVQSFLATHPLARSQQFKLTFSVSIAEKGLTEAFLRLLNLRRVGSFSGVEEGTERLNRMLSAVDFDTATGLKTFLHGLLTALREDQRPGRGKGAIELRDQLANDVNPDELYNLLFGLGYLDPIYTLKWDGKNLEQLSPGERGNLLLIFYLLIDRDNIPLVIDQPEENLDNNTVYRTLVPCVKEAKKRRQVIMVTHNPNLAVVCDAEQIICAEMKKDQSNEITYIAGSIENPIINQKLVDVLEGTRPAFDKRDSKYLETR